MKQDDRSLSRQIPQYDSGHYLYDRTFYFSTALTEDSEQTKYSKILNLAQLFVDLFTEYNANFYSLHLFRCKRPCRVLIMYCRVKQLT